MDAFGLKRAQESVSFADEVLIIRDSDRIEDFSEIRNRTLHQAKGEWVLFIDSDEEVTAKLATEIQRVLLISKIKNLFGLAQGGHKSKRGFFIRRKDHFLGRWLKFGETGGTRFLRLARKDAGKWVRPVHERWVVDGPVGVLSHPLLHRPHQSTIAMLGKINRYAEVEARYRQRVALGSSIRIVAEMIVFPKVKFFQNYMFRLGCLDGFPGLIMTLMMSFHSFLVRAYQLELLMKKR